MFRPGVMPSKPVRLSNWQIRQGGWRSVYVDRVRRRIERGQSRAAEKPQVCTPSVRGNRSDENGTDTSTTYPSAVILASASQMASHDQSSEKSTSLLMASI